MFDFSVTFIITIINIIILTFILRALLFKPVTKFMATRARQIQNTVDQSEKDRVQAKSMLAQYEAQLKNAENEANAILHTAKEQAAVEAERIIAESRASVEATLASVRKQLENEHRAALDAFRTEAAALVVAATGRLVGREIKSEDNRQYVKILLDEVSHLEETPQNEAGKG